MPKRSSKRIKISESDEPKQNDDGTVEPGPEDAPPIEVVANQQLPFPTDILGEIIPSLETFVICRMDLTCKSCLEGSLWDHVQNLDLDDIILLIISHLKEPASLLKFKKQFLAISERILRHHAKMSSVSLHSAHHISHPFYERVYLPWLQKLTPQITTFCSSIESIQIGVRFPFLSHLNSARLDHLCLDIGPADQPGEIDLPQWFSNNFSHLRRLKLRLTDSGALIDPILVALTGTTGHLESVSITTRYSRNHPSQPVWTAVSASSVEKLSKFCHSNQRTLRRLVIGEGESSVLPESSIGAALDLEDLQSASAWQEVDSICRAKFVVPLSGLRIDNLDLWNACVVARADNEKFRLQQIDDLFQLCFPVLPKFEFALKSFNSIWRTFEFPIDQYLPDEARQDNLAYVLRKPLNYIEHVPDWVHSCRKPQATLEALGHIVSESNRVLSPPERFVTPAIREQHAQLVAGIKAAINARPALLKTRNIDFLGILFNEDTNWINQTTKIELAYIFYFSPEDYGVFGAFAGQRTIIERLLLSPKLMTKLLPFTGETVLVAQTHILTALIKVHSVVPQDYGDSIRFIFNLQRRNPEKYECFSILMNTAHTDTALSIILQQQTLLRPFIPALLAVSEIDPSIAKVFFQYVYSSSNYRAIALAFIDPTSPTGALLPDCGLTTAELKKLRLFLWRTCLQEASTAPKLQSGACELLARFKRAPQQVVDFALKPDAESDLRCRIVKSKARKVLAEIFSDAANPVTESANV